MAQSIDATITGLYAAAQAAFSATTSADGVAALVTLGLPGQYQPNIVVAVATAVRMPVTRPTMGTARSREITAEIDMVISVYVPGDESAQVSANSTALTMQRTFEDYLRTNTNPQLGGGCRDSWVSFASLTPDVIYDASSTPSPTGRVADNTLTVTAAIRY